LGIYERYAGIYDQSGQIGFSLRMIPYLWQVLERYGFQGDTVLDLACGTGTMALAMAQRGWRTYGVDGSAAMLAQARRKAEETGLPLLLSQQDMRSFTLPERVDLITCFFDTLNYMLTPEDLQQVFSRVAQYLKTGGLFVGDMNTLYALAEIWDHNTYFSETVEASVIMQSEYDEEPHIATVHLIAFARQEDGRYERLEEIHKERAYPEVTVAAALRRAGLQVLDRFECFGFQPPTSRSPRILWVATRAGSPVMNKDGDDPGCSG